MLLRSFRRRTPGGSRREIAAGVRRGRLPAAAGGAVLLAGLATTLPLAAQSGTQSGTGVITGKVTAAGDTAIAGATVLVDGTLLSTVTNSQGVYRLTGFPSGLHTLRAAAMGYAAAVRRNVEVGAGDTLRVDFSLKTSPFSLPGVIVTASRQTEEITQSAASVSVLTHKAITQRDVTQLSQALPYAPGVTYQGGTLDIRGAAGLSGGVGSRVLLMLDGHPLITGDTGELDFDILPVLGVSRVEIVKGPYSALYGSNALGGVVNVVTSPIPDQPHTVIRTHFGAYDIPDKYQFTSGLLHFQGLEMQHSLHVGSVGLRVYGDRDVTDGFTQNGHTSRWLFRVEADAPLFGANPSSFYVIGAREDIGENFGWRSAQQRFEVPVDAVGDWYRMGWVDFGATLNVFTRASSALKFSPYVYYDAVQNHFHDNHEYHRSTRGGSSVQFSLVPGADQSLTLGGEAAYTTVASDVIGAPTVRDYALFAQDAIEPNPRWKASVGVRFDDHSVTPGRVDNQLSPKLGVVFHATSDLSLRASVGRAFRAPSPVEQFVSTTQYGVLVVPNKDLRPETEVAGELGATADLGRLWVDGAFFQSRFNSLIQPGPVPGRLFVFQFQNVARARITGVDLEVRFDLVPRVLGLDATYMYLDPRDLTAHQPLPYRSAHTATGTLTVLGGLLGVDLQYRSRVERVLQYPADPRSSTTLVGLRAAYEVAGLLLQAKVTNLFQETYVNLQERFPGAPRSFSLTVSKGMTESR